MIPSRSFYIITAAATSLSSQALSAETGTHPTIAPLEVRYTPWSELSDDVRNVAKSKLGYSKTTWNVLGFADIEKRGWWELTDEEIEGATELGYTEESWDCWIHHYDSYTWSELESMSIDTHLRALGWTKASWTGSADQPETEAKWWGQLSDQEKTNAMMLCYFEDNWNMEDMTPNDGPFPYPKPEFRYVPWHLLPADAQNTATESLSYDKESWNNPMSAEVELNTYYNLDESQRDGAFELGFYPQTWDCFQNHFMSYFWGSFYGERKTAIEILGWTEESWNGEIDEPDTEGTVWEGLTEEEQKAAMVFCYFQETWDGESLELPQDDGAPDPKQDPTQDSDQDSNQESNQDSPSTTTTETQRVSPPENSVGDTYLTVSTRISCFAANMLFLVGPVLLL